MKRSHLILLSVLIAVGVITAAALYRYHHPLAATKPTIVATQGTQPATTQLAAKPPRKRGPATQLLDIARAADPKYPTTRRLNERLDLKYAAHIPLDHPVYLDHYRHLWIARPDAPENFDFTRAHKTETLTHVLREEVVFVYWAANENNLPLPHLIVRSRSPRVPYELLDYNGRRSLPDPHGYDFSRALVLYGPGQGQFRDRIVVPTRTGVAAFHFDQPLDQIAASHQTLINPTANQKSDDIAVQLVMDMRGVIAWVTNAAGTRGLRGVARLAPLPRDPNNPDAEAPLDYKWTVLTGKTGWPDGILHLRPLLDGSVLQIISPDGEKVRFSVNSIETVAIDEQAVIKLILQLSDADAAKRELAFKQLTNYGPGIAPILERSKELLDPEAQIRVRQLLNNRIEPGLGSMSLIDGKMKVASRFPDGGVLFYSQAGVAIPRGEETPTYITPAWLSIRPGHYVQLLPESLTADIRPGQQTITAWGSEYIVLDQMFGPQRFIGNRLEPLLRKPERRYAQFVGIDEAGRWIFNDPSPPPAPATTRTTATTTTITSDSSLALRHASFLILDPRLPDPTPRLPGWQLPRSAGAAGWDKDHWPVIYMDAKPKPVPWALTTTGWRAIDTAKEKVTTDPKDLPPIHPPQRPATTTTSPTTASTQDSVLSTQDFLLTAPDGTHYYGGKDSLRVIHPSGDTVTWPLPDHAIGTAEKPTLLRSRDGLLFLFNEPGRIIRIRPNVDAETNEPFENEPPFQVDATFSRSVPTDPSPLRIWLDPADRICIAHDQNHITVLFPPGRIPPAISSIMPLEENPPEQ